MYLVSTGARVDVLAPAKLNLFLEVHRRRPDGFHDIETVMTAVSLYDSLSFEASVEGLELRARYGRSPSAGSFAPSANAGLWGDLPQGAGNLVLRALEQLRQAAGVRAGARVQLVKRIPSAAGLGGASSDAAAALLAGNELWGVKWSRARLRALAGVLGSDVAFFLGDDSRRMSGAVCRGRGEQIEPLSWRERLHFVIVKPPAGLSTAAVYSACRPAETPRPSEPLITALRQGSFSVSGTGMWNRLEEPAAELSPEINELREQVKQHAWGAHQMSGSGTSHFVLCRSARHARHVAARLHARRVGLVFAVHSVPLLPPLPGLPRSASAT